MLSLKVNYLGLELGNPIIVASSPFTSSIESMLECERAGAAAVVLKSVFEEQILGESSYLSRFNDYPEAMDYLNNFVGTEYIKGHLAMITEAKKKLKIPVVASINCLGAGSQWVNYAKMIEMAGADAIELNLFTLPLSQSHTAAEIEEQYFKVIEKVTSAVKIPVSVKLGNKFTNVLNVAKEIYFRNAKGIVMFNRFFEPDINIETEALVSSEVISTHNELRNTLRSVAFCSAEVEQIDIAVTTGVHTGDDLIKSLLVGASCVQVCSALYKDGMQAIELMNLRLMGWMRDRGYKSIDEFRGKMAFKEHGDSADLLQRVQYMKYFPRP